MAMFSPIEYEMLQTNPSAAPSGPSQAVLQTREQERPRKETCVALSQPRLMILNIYGAYGRRLGGWISVAALVELLGELGIDERAVRAAVSRMKRREILVSKRRDRRFGYTLTGQAEAILDEGDRRLFARREPAVLDDGWVVVVFSVPESERRKRHLLRSRLAWEGFGNVSAGVWIAPWRLAEEARTLLVRLDLDGYVDLFHAHHEGFGATAEKVGRWWDLGRLGAEYAQFIEEQSSVLERWRVGGGDDRVAFIDYLSAVAAWQRFPYLDPGLPAELLPTPWEGQRAAQVFFELGEMLADRGERHAAAVLRGHDA